MYCDINYKTKKALREAISNGVTVTVFQPGGMFPSATDGNVSLEGPHYPLPHKWYARAKIANGAIVKLYK